ncbi:MAG: PAS domain-containing sensor histidine kinase [Calditrichaceae bacterium]
MNRIFNISFKTRIILIFSLITVLLVGLMARVSYVFVREIYQRQLEEQVLLLNKLTADDLDQKYLDYIEPGTDNFAYEFYKNILTENVKRMRISNAFLFDGKMRILISVNQEISDTRLLLSRSEISELTSGEGAISTPFKSQDGQWYLWGFYRLNEHYYLGIQESAARLAKLDDLSLMFLIIGLAGIVVVIGGAWFGAGAIVSPINKLAKFSSDIGSGLFNTKVPENITGELIILRDALVKMKDDLAQMQTEKENILAEIAHEIRNPLGGIELLTGLVREETDVSSKNNVYLNKILEEVQSLKSQITAYLDYSRPLIPEPQMINPDQLCSELNGLFLNQMAGKKIGFEYRNHLETIRFDKQHLRQILINLVANSIEAIGQEGTVLIESYQKNDHSYITVSDNGHGIQEADLVNLFKPFFTTRKKGTGLGLSVCKKLCRENNAEISVLKSAGKGCTFQILVKNEI